MKKDIGVGVKPPEKECEDINCPWHGQISVRGRVFQGSVRSAKSRNTVIVEWGYHRFIPKYERYERRKSRVVAHNPPCIHAREGELVVIAECRPISKTKHFVVAGKLGRAKLEVKGEEQKIAMKEKPPKEIKEREKSEGGKAPRKEGKPVRKKKGLKDELKGMPEKEHNLNKGTKKGLPEEEAKK